MAATVELSRVSVPFYKHLFEDPSTRPDVVIADGLGPLPLFFAQKYNVPHLWLWNFSWYPLLEQQIGYTSFMDTIHQWFSSLLPLPDPFFLAMMMIDDE